MKQFLILIISVSVLSAGVYGIDSGKIDVDGIKKKWIQTAPPAPEFSDEQRQSELSARRKRVAETMPEGSVLVLFSAESKLYAYDVDYVYRQENNLFYLTGINQNGVGFLLSKHAGEVREALFLPVRNPRFETWNGRMLSNEDAVRISGIGNVVDAAEWSGLLGELKNGKAFTAGEISGPAPSAIYVLTGDNREYPNESDFAKQVPEPKLRNAFPIFARLRLVKSEYEIELMQHAVNITNEALMRSMGMIGRAKWEYEVQAEVEYTFRRRNADFWGYPSIVGCGPNATTLHYVESQGVIGKNDLMLMDVGAEFRHYTADVTRTFPVSGKFTKEQSENISNRI